MPVKNNGPGMTGRSSMTKKSKIEPEYPQWAESKMRAIENRRLKELKKIVRESMPEILAIVAEEQKTGSDSIRHDGYSDMVRRIQNRFRIMRDRLSRRLKTDPLERDVRRCADYTDRRQLKEWQRSVRATLGVDIHDDFFLGERYDQMLKRWVEQNVSFITSICETTGISSSPVSDAMLRTAVIHATAENDCVNCAYASRFLSYDPGSEQWCFKSLSMVSAQGLSTTDIASLETRNISYYTTVGSKAMVQGGKVSGGEWIDTIRFRDWLKTEIQSKVLNLLLGLPKVPYTDQGIALVQNAVIDALEEGVRAGGIVQDASSDDGEASRAYTVTVPRAADLDAATRKSRRLTGVTWTAQLAGALIAAKIGGTLNY